MGSETNPQSGRSPPASFTTRVLILAEQGSEIDPIRTETIFSRMPLHVLSKSGRRPQINIEKRSADGRSIEEKWEVSYNEKYGPAQQLAYDVHTLVIERAIEEAFDEARRTAQPFPRLIPLHSLNDVASRLGPECRNPQHEPDKKSAQPERRHSDHSLEKVSWQRRSGVCYRRSLHTIRNLFLRSEAPRRPACRPGLHQPQRRIF